MQVGGLFAFSVDMQINQKGLIVLAKRAWVSFCEENSGESE